MKLRSITYLSAVLVALSAISTPASAQLDQSGDLNLTLYQDGTMLVFDSRMVDLSRGENILKLTGFPTSLQLNSVLPQLNGTVKSTSFDLNRPGFHTMIQRLVGQHVRLDHNDGGSVTGELVEYSSGLIVIKQSDGSHVVLPGLDGYRISTENLPDIGTDFPVLTLNVNANAAGNQKLGLYYLSHGIQWQTEYALILSENEQRAVLNGWAVIQNGSDKRFDNARVQLVAGDLNLGRGAGQARPDRMMRVAAMESQMAFDGGVESESFFEYQRFLLPGRFSIGPNEIQKLGLIPEKESAARKRYRYASSDSRMEVARGGLVQVMFDIENSREDGFGMAIPSGTVKIYKKDGDELQLIGQDDLRNTPVGATIQITTGMAFDILVMETVTAQNRISDRISEQSNKIDIKNERKESATVEVTRHLSSTQRITQSTIPHTMRSANVAVFEVPVRQGETKSLEFTIRTER
ncbi:MAG: hypothetical protein LAT57_05470 [Balneolales bacterium]|nr:hypothetical protein [Balneolales bacterium]